MASAIILNVVGHLTFLGELNLQISEDLFKIARIFIALGPPLAALAYVSAAFFYLKETEARSPRFIEILLFIRSILTTLVQANIPTTNHLIWEELPDPPQHNSKWPIAHLLHFQNLLILLVIVSVISTVPISQNLSSDGAPVYTVSGAAITDDPIIAVVIYFVALSIYYRKSKKGNRALNDGVTF